MDDDAKAKGEPVKKLGSRVRRVKAALSDMAEATAAAAMATVGFGGVVTIQAKAPRKPAKAKAKAPAPYVRSTEPGIPHRPGRQAVGMVWRYMRPFSSIPSDGVREGGRPIETYRAHRRNKAKALRRSFRHDQMGKPPQERGIAA